MEKKDYSGGLPAFPPDPEQAARDEEIVRGGFWDQVRRTIGKVPFTEDIVASWYCATDRNTPAHVKAILMAALAYFVVPTDVIPDFIAGLGFTDDAAILTAALAAIRNNLTPGHRSSARKFLDREKSSRDGA